MHLNSVLHVYKILLMHSLAELCKVRIWLNDFCQSISRKCSCYQSVQVSKHCSIQLCRSATISCQSKLSRMYITQKYNNTVRTEYQLTRKSTNQMTCKKSICSHGGYSGLMADYQIHISEIAGSIHTMSSPNNLEQVANLWWVQPPTSGKCVIAYRL